VIAIAIAAIELLGETMNRLRYSAAVGCVALAVAAVAPSKVCAQGGVPNCADLTNPIFMGGTTAVLPVIRLLGARLKLVGVTLLWNEADEGCSGVEHLAHPEEFSTQQRVVFTQYTETDTGSGKVSASTCNGGVGQIADLVINDVAYASCEVAYGSTNQKNLPAGLGEFQGPVQGLVPIVPSSYTYYNDITAEELQDLYVCGAAAKILTFTDNPHIFDYDPLKSGTHESWSRGLGLANGSVPTSQIGLGPIGNMLTAETMVTVAVAASTSPDVTIGYTSTEFYDQYRDKVHALKVRGLNQNLAYWPDSDVTNADKLNIREGRYMLQGTLRLVAAVDASGKATNAGARHMIDWFQGNVPESADLQLPFDVNAIYAQRGVVPQCAMKVTHDGDLPVFKHYTPARPCHCAFQVLATGNASIEGCVPCKDVSACQASQQCSYGYCE